MSDLKLSAIFTFVDKMTAPVKQLIKTTEKLEKGFLKVKDKAKGMTDKVNAAGKALDVLKKKEGETEKTSNKLAGALGALGGILSVATFIGLGKGIWEVNSKFEQYEATLTTVLGSQKKANAALKWVTDFSTRTPYELDEVTAAFVKLNSYGINAMDGTLENAGNWASGMGKSLDQVVEAMADARTGEFERLKELGVTTKTVGDKITFSYSQNGQMMTKTTKKTAKDIQNALNEIASTNFAGSMLRQSKTAKGILSNLQDWFTGFQKKIGDAGVFDHIKNKLGGFLDKLNLVSNNGQAATWANNLSVALTKLFDAVFDALSKIDWVALIDGLTKFVTWLSNAANKVLAFVDAMGGFGNLINLGIGAWIFSLIAGFTSMVPAIQAVGAALFGLELAAAPITLIILAVAAVIAIIFIFRKQIMSVLSAIWEGFKKLPVWAQVLISLPAAIIANFGKIKDTIMGILSSIWNVMPSWFKGMVNGTLKLIAPSQQTAPVAAIGNNSSSKMSADVNIKVQGPGKATSVKSSNNNLGVNVWNGFQGAGVY